MKLICNDMCWPVSGQEMDAIVSASKFNSSDPATSFVSTAPNNQLKDSQKTGFQ
jgi:hypothetical protein